MIFDMYGLELIAIKKLRLTEVQDSSNAFWNI